MTEARPDTRRSARRRERRARMQEDHMLTAAVLAAEGGLDDFEGSDSREGAKAPQRRKNEAPR